MESCAFFYSDAYQGPLTLILFYGKIKFKFKFVANEQLLGCLTFFRLF